MSQVKLPISEITNHILEIMRTQMEEKLGIKISILDCIAFILEDYTKSYYQRILDSEIKKDEP